MRNQQPSSTAARMPYYDTDTSQASRTGSRADNGVPPGTVASRVQFLQRLQATSNSRPGPAHSGPAPSSSNRRRENSRTGFGRRITNRFGPPALQSGPPFEEVRADTSHSFLGLNTPRKSHIEEHGLADNRIQYSKSPGINGTVAQVTRERAQFDAVAPWEGLSRTKSSRSMGRRKGRNYMDDHRSERLAYHGHIVAEATIFPLPTPDDNPNNFRQEIKSREADTLKSENSYATTSTIRRQSVRDLFENHGIERPEGLASSNESSREIEETQRPNRPHRFCHLCAWVNSGPSTKCWRCSHRLCSICDSQSPQPVTRKEASLGYSERVTKSKGVENQSSHNSASAQKVVHSEPRKRSSTRPGPSPIQARVEEHTLQGQKQPSPTTKFPDYHPELPPLAKPSQATHPPKTSPKTPQNAVPGPSKAQVRTSIKESPFLIADSTAKKKSITLFPFDHRGDRYQKIRDQHEHQPHQQDQRGRHSSSRSSDREREEYRSSRCEHRSHRHVISRVNEKETHYCREATENGYVADTSQAEDESHTHLHPHTQESHQFSNAHPTSTSNPQPHASREAFHTHDHEENTAHETCVPEFVECHGYPRTGHISHGSCSGAELPGECQHCIEDCQCAACQNTHHNVRCCIHKDHKAMVHQHHTPRKDDTTSDIHVRPLSTPRRASIPSHSVTSITPRPHTTKIEPLRTQSPVQGASPSHGSSTQPSLEKVPSIPLTKRSTFIKEASKPPTPPPWVSQPRSSLLKPAQHEPIDESPKEEVPDPFASLRKSRSPRPPAPETWGESSQDLNYLQSNTKNSYTQAEGRNHALQESHERYTLPSRKPSVFEEKVTGSSKGTTRSSSNTGIFSPGSRRDSRRMSTLFQPREENDIPGLTQELLQHQQEPPDSRNKHDARHIGAARPRDVASIAHNLEHKKETFEKAIGKSDKPEALRKSRIPSRAVSTESTRKWRLRLVDKRPSPPCKNDEKKVLGEHRLEDDGLERRNFEKQDRKVMSEARLDIRKRSANSHECTWKKMALELQNGNSGHCNHKESGSLGIIGVTIILHFEDKEDMVLRAGSWSASGEPRVLR